MSVNDINSEIGEKIMAWDVDREQRLYREPSREAGAYSRLPDFVANGSANHILRSKMQSLDYVLTITEDPPDFEENIGRMFTATYVRANRIFQSTQGDQNLAVLRPSKPCGIRREKEHILLEVRTVGPVMCPEQAVLGILGKSLPAITRIFADHCFDTAKDWFHPRAL